MKSMGRMERIVIIISIVIISFGIAYGATKTILQLTEETAPTSDDLLHVWEVTGGNSRKVSLSNATKGLADATTTTKGVASFGADDFDVSSGAVTIDASIARDAEVAAGYQPLDATLTAWAAYNTNGLLTQTAADTFTGRTLTGDAEIVVANGDGIAGNPTLSIGTGITRDAEHDTWAEQPALTENYILQGNASNQPAATNTLTVDTVNLSAASKYQVAGGQLDYDDMAGSAAVSTTGTIAGDVPLLGTFDTPITTNPYTLTAANSRGGTLYYGATGEIDLAAASTGLTVLIYNTGAFTITIDPNGTEVIVRDGTAQTGGVSMTLSSGAGNYVAMISDGVKWITLGYKGTLAAGS